MNRCSDEPRQLLEGCCVGARLSGTLEEEVSRLSFYFLSGSSAGQDQIDYRYVNGRRGRDKTSREGQIHRSVFNSAKSLIQTSSKGSTVLQQVSHAGIVTETWQGNNSYSLKLTVAALYNLKDLYTIDTGLTQVAYAVSVYSVNSVHAYSIQRKMHLSLPARDAGLIRRSELQLISCEPVDNLHSSFLKMFLKMLTCVCVCGRS